jgi:D-sedoheptulose 7-phosphate isomerase
MTIDTLLDQYPQLAKCRTVIDQAAGMLVAAYVDGHKVLTCGNGGSAADAEHIVGELMKGFLSKRPLSAEARQALVEAGGDDGAYMAENLQTPLPAISLVSSVSLATAFANDVAPELTFAQQVYGLGQPGDVLIALSTSGNSRNVVLAVLAARVRGMRTIGMTGGSGGRLKELCDVTINVPAQATPVIQELHLPVYHYLCAAVEACIFGAT